MLELEKKIGYIFKDKQLLKTSLTHKSFSSNNNERLEFLGDSIINVYITEKLFDLNIVLPEGKLTQIRASLVSRSSLNDIASSINLEDFIYLGKGESTENNSICGNTFEALIGAIFKDESKKSVYKVLDKFFEHRLKNQIKKGSSKDAKSSLQEILQKQKMNLPIYKSKDFGPGSGNNRFEVTCEIPSLGVMSKGKGKNIKKAELEAAKSLLEKLDIE